MLSLASNVSAVETAQNFDSEPIAVGRVKSFSQKSGWGFIQLFENGEEDSEGSKDVFFHRADVARSGTCELRPGILVHCRVVSTGKGEKASDIKLIEEPLHELPKKPMTTPMTCVTCLGSSEDLLSHSPYGSEITTVLSPTTVPPTAFGASYSLRTTENYTSWLCCSCRTHNASRSIRRVMVICASCGLVHQVKQWICACSYANKHTSRHCAQCDVPYALGCQELSVLPAMPVEDPTTEYDETSMYGRRAQRVRSRWQHGQTGWTHPSVEAPAASTWCQDATQHPMCSERVPSDMRFQAVSEKCKDRLLWAFGKLAKDSTAALAQRGVTREWLYRFSEEVAKAEHQLLCCSGDWPAFVPNPCADMEEEDAPHMYEAIGMMLALALTGQQALQPHFPMWMARSLLGYPTTMEDLADFDPALLQKAETAIPASEEITRYGTSRTFEVPENVAGDQRAYAMWLKDLYLSRSIAAQMKQIKHGFFYALMGDHVMQTLSPIDCCRILNGESCL